MFEFLLVFALSVSVTDVIPDFYDYETVAIGQCLPPGEKETRMCMIIKKDNKELMTVWSLSKQLLEVRDEKKILYKSTWHKA